MKYKNLSVSDRNSIRCEAITSTNFTILWICFCLIMELVSLGTNTWYIQKDSEIKYWHGGLWNQCLGEIDRTFCSYLRYTPVWLKATQTIMLIAMCTMFINIIYVIVGVARQALRISVMLGLTNITTLLFFTAIMVYTFKGFSDNTSPGTSFIVAWVTLICHLIAALLSLFSFMRVSKLTMKQAVDSGMRI